MKTKTENFLKIILFRSFPRFKLISPASSFLSHIVVFKTKEHNYNSFLQNLPWKLHFYLKTAGHFQLKTSVRCPFLGQGVFLQKWSEKISICFKEMRIHVPLYKVSISNSATFSRIARKVKFIMHNIEINEFVFGTAFLPLTSKRYCSTWNNS